MTSAPLELTAASSIASECRAGITAYSTVNAYSPGRAMKTNPPKARRKTAEQDPADKRRVVIRLALSLPDHLIDWPYLVTLPRKRREGNPGEVERELTGFPQSSQLVPYMISTTKDKTHF